MLEPTVIDSKLYVAEGEARGRTRAQADLVIDDPTEDEAKQAIARNTVRATTPKLINKENEQK